ncbi:MAG: hypothetical protein IIZ39_09020, partial [Blautia sp.]|nr:hypothetical protein [Blautia sp.]
MPHSSGGGSHGGGGHYGGSYHGSGSRSSQPPQSRAYHSYHEGTRRYVYYYLGRPHYYWSKDTPSQTSFHKWSAVLIPILVVWVIITLAFLSPDQSFKVFENIKPLKGEHYEILIEDTLDVLSSKEESRLYQAFSQFQEQTGITPAFISATNDDWVSYYSSMENYAYDLYVNRFLDEKHWLLVYSSAPTEDGTSFEDWHWEGMQGDDTDRILTEDVTKNFTDLIQKNLTARNFYSVGESFINGFEDLNSKELTGFKVYYAAIVG